MFATIAVHKLWTRKITVETSIPTFYRLQKIFIRDDASIILLQTMLDMINKTLRDILFELRVPFAGKYLILNRILIRTEL